MYALLLIARRHTSRARSSVEDDPAVCWPICRSVVRTRSPERMFEKGRLAQLHQQSSPKGIGKHGIASRISEIAEYNGVSFGERLHPMCLEEQNCCDHSIRSAPTQRQPDPSVFPGPVLVVDCQVRPCSDDGDRPQSREPMHSGRPDLSLSTSE